MDLNKTLNELEGVAWGEPEYHSHIVTTCHRLRRVPIGEFSIEDLRIMIGQQIGLLWLVPLGLVAVEADPLAEGDFYPGDLLRSLLRIDRSFWQRHAVWRRRLVSVVRSLDEVPEEVSEDVARFIAAS